MLRLGSRRLYHEAEFNSVVAAQAETPMQATRIYRNGEGDLSGTKKRRFIQEKNKHTNVQSAQHGAWPFWTHTYPIEFPRDISKRVTLMFSSFEIASIILLRFVPCPRRYQRTHLLLRGEIARLACVLHFQRASGFRECPCRGPLSSTAAYHDANTTSVAMYSNSQPS